MNERAVRALTLCREDRDGHCEVHDGWTGIENSRCLGSLREIELLLRELTGINPASMRCLRRECCLPDSHDGEHVFQAEA